MRYPVLAVLLHFEPQSKKNHLNMEASLFSDLMCFQKLNDDKWKGQREFKCQVKHLLLYHSLPTTSSQKRK